MSLLIRDGTLVTMDGARRIVRGDLLIEGGCIAALGGDLGAAKVARRLDAGGALVIPGLVQAHVHLCQTLFRGMAEGRELLEWLGERILPLEAAHDAHSLRASARLGMAELLLSGTTTIQDMGTVRHTEVLFEEAARFGLRYFGGKALLDQGEGIPAKLLDSTRDALDESEALAARYHGAEGGRLRYAHAPRFLLSCSDELLSGASALAKERGARLHTHANENRRECEAARARTGLDTIEHFARLGFLGPDLSLAHCIHMTPGEVELLAQSGSSVIHCPSSNLKLASGLAPVPEFLQRGLCVALGADGAACSNGLDAFTELRLAALIHLPRAGAKAMPAEQVFAMATIGGARALGLAEEVGSLEVGKRADLAIVEWSGAHHAPNDDPYASLVFSARGSDVRAVVVDGRVLVEEGRLLEQELPSIVSEARAQRAKVAARAGLR